MPLSALSPRSLRGRGRSGRLLGRFGRRCAKHRNAALGLAGAATLLCGLVASDVNDHLSNGGYTVSGSQSAKADDLLAERFDQRPPDLILLVVPDGRVGDKKVAERGRDLTERIAEEPGVANVRSYWSPHSGHLGSKDRKSALMAVTLKGDDGKVTRTAEKLVPRAADMARPWKVSATGPAWTNVQFIEQGHRDQRRAEIIVVPITVVILLAAFGSAYAAIVPAVVGAVAVVGTLAVMRLLTGAMAISVLAPNLATAIGFGLAIDYSLFLVTRYREELSRGAAVAAAIERAMRTAGRTVLFSAVTVMAALCGLLVFPLAPLRSLACAAMTVVLMAAAAALLVVPALLATIGTRIDRYDPFARLRRSPGQPPPHPASRRGRPVLVGGTLVCVLGLVTMSLTRIRPSLAADRPRAVARGADLLRTAAAGAAVRFLRKAVRRRAVHVGSVLLGMPVAAASSVGAVRARRAAANPYEADNRTWRRIAEEATRRPVLLGGGCALLLVLLALPFMHAEFGLTDERSLPAHIEAHSVADRIGRDFAEPLGRGLTIVMPDAPGRSRLGEYAERVSSQPGVLSVRTSTGTYAKGKRTGKAEGRYTAEKAVLLDVATKVEPQSAEGKRLLRHVRDVPAPGKRLVTGASAHSADTLSALGDAMPLALGVIACFTFLLLFLFTGGVLVSLKALVLGALSLSASFGVVVLVFQDGHAAGLVGGFTVTGRLDAMTLLLAFTIAFGLSIDYEVFLLSRIKENYHATGRHTDAIVTGIARTGRLVTAAALVVAISMGALITSSNTVLKMNGLGLAVAVLVDATLVRGLLVPAVMQLTGPRNWWAPAPLARLHRRVGLAEDAPARRRFPRVRRSALSH